MKEESWDWYGWNLGSFLGLSLDQLLGPEVKCRVITAGRGCVKSARGVCRALRRAQHRYFPFFLTLRFLTSFLPVLSTPHPPCSQYQHSFLNLRRLSPATTRPPFGEDSFLSPAFHNPHHHSVIFNAVKPASETEREHLLSQVPRTKDTKGKVLRAVPGLFSKLQLLLTIVLLFISHKDPGESVLTADPLLSAGKKTVAHRK